MSEELTELPTKLNSLPEETRQEKWAAMKARKAFAAVFTPFVKAMREAMNEYRHFRSKGVSREDGIKGIEAVMRDVWPKHTTKYPPKCEDCDDIGYQELICRPYVRCQRPKCAMKGEDWQHRYVVPCSCPSGDRYRERVVSAEDAFSSVGKSSKSKGWNRL